MNKERNLRRRQLSYMRQKLRSSNVEPNDNSNTVVNHNYSDNTYDDECKGLLYLLLLIALVSFLLFGSVILWSMNGDVNGNSSLVWSYFMKVSEIASLLIGVLAMFSSLKYPRCISVLFAGILYMVFFPIIILALVFNFSLILIPISIATAFVFLLGMLKK